MRAVHGLLFALCCTSCGGEPVAVEAEGARDAARPPLTPAAPEEVAVPTEPIEVEELEDGLRVEVFTTGAGAAARAGSELVLHYTARVEGDEEPFDSSRSRGLPDRWRLGASARPRLIAGLDRALRGRRAGFRARVLVPSDLAWGSEGYAAGGVGPDADLVYDIHVLEIR